MFGNFCKRKTGGVCQITSGHFGSLLAGRSPRRVLLSILPLRTPSSQSFSISQRSPRALGRFTEPPVSGRFQVVVIPSTTLQKETIIGGEGGIRTHEARAWLFSRQLPSTARSPLRVRSITKTTATVNFWLVKAQRGAPSRTILPGAATSPCVAFTVSTTSGA